MQGLANGAILLRNKMAESYTVSEEQPVAKAHVIPAAAIIALIVVSGLLSISNGAMQLGVNTGFLPAYGSVTFMGDFITAVLLFSQARAANDSQLACLGSAYAFSAIIIIPHLMAIPGVFSPEALIGAPASAVWLWVFWHAGFALGVVNFALRKPGESDRPVAVWLHILSTIVIASAAVMLATLGETLLPIILVSGSYGRLQSLGFSPAVLACSVAGLVLVVLRLRRATPLLIWLAVAMVASVMDVTLTMLGEGRFTLDWYLARWLSVIAGFSVLCALLADFIRLFTSVTKANRHLKKLSFTDPLTEVANRRSFEQRLGVEWRRAFREQLPLSMVMIDIDQFKLYNDHFGHPAGDECLRAVAAALTQHARRPWDMPARMGGEEFAVLLPNTEEDQAAKLAERLRSGIEELRLPHPSSIFQIVTISVGVATMYPRDQMPQELIAAADAALYVAKTTGRNRFHQHGVPGRQEMIDGVMRHVSGIA
jgi:diguanylate cyclase (GGDEF)-like protein